MISDLFHVKLYRGLYDGTSDLAPTSSFDSSDGYRVGFRLLCRDDGLDYVCSDATVGAAVWAVNSVNDIQILYSLKAVSSLVTKYCNRLFISDNPDYYESVAVVYTANELQDFSAYFTTLFYPGDSIAIMGSKRNDGTYSVDEVTDTKITIVDQFQLPHPDNSAQIILGLTWPVGLREIGARMAEYDTYRRNSRAGLASESVGNYSYSKETTDLLGIAYPNSVIAGIHAYKRPRIADGNELGFMGYRFNG